MLAKLQKVLHKKARLAVFFCRKAAQQHNSRHRKAVAKLAQHECGTDASQMRNGRFTDAKRPFHE